MTPQQFASEVAQDRFLKEPIEDAGAELAPPAFGPPTELAVLVLMFPIVKYLLTRIGLPWLHELTRYSELQRQRVSAWIDEKHRQHGLDPQKAKQASQSLIKNLDNTTDKQARKAWERLCEQLKQDNQQ